MSIGPINGEENKIGSLVNDENKNSLDEGKYKYVYHDTLYFINAIVHDYKFYDDILRLIKSGPTEVEYKKKKVLKLIDEQWVSAIEDSLIALDNIVRRPSRTLQEIEQVLPIELSRNITERSIRHLAQHTNYISKIEGDMITPSKILNIYRDETLETYENKFVNTLVYRLYTFVNKRYTQLIENGNNEDVTKLEFTSEFTSGNLKGKFHFGIELTEDTSKIDENSPKIGGSDSPTDDVPADLWARVVRLNEIVTEYMSSPFVQALGRAYIRPPVMRTNAITKNKDLRQCLMLWEFIESYEKIGYEIRIQELAKKPNDTYIDELYSMLALQYVIFKYNIKNELEKDEKLSETETEEPLKPKFITEFDEYDVDEYNVYDTYYKKVMPVSMANNRRKLTQGELRIREAIDVALAAAPEVKRIKEEKEAERRRLAEIEAMRRAEEERIRREEEERRQAEEAARRAREEQIRKALEEEEQKRREEEERRLAELKAIEEERKRKHKERIQRRYARKNYSDKPKSSGKEKRRTKMHKKKKK